MDDVAKTRSRRDATNTATALVDDDEQSGRASREPQMCELARNNDPLRGGFRVQSRPL